jgi:chromate transporter
VPGPPIPPPERASLVRPSLATLTSVFFRIGNTTFGGGLPTIAAMQREFVEQRLWLSPEDYALAFSLARVTPGTNVIAFCAAVGAQILGFAGALAGALAETVPSAVLAILMTQGYESWRTNVWVAAGLTGTIAAVAGMMWSSIYSLVSPHVGTVGNAIRAAAITLGAFIAVWKFGWGPLTIIALAAIVGMVWTEPEAS